MKPFNRERFLFTMLAGIFIWQAAIFSAGVFSCFKLGGLRECPDLGKRYETTVNVMVATTLALLTGGAVVGVTQRKESSSGDRDASASVSPQPSKLQASVQEKVRASAQARPPARPE